MKHILMVLFKDIDYDARVQREAIALAESGYQVTICSLNEFDTEPPFLHNLITIYKLDISTKQAKKGMGTGSSQKPSIVAKMVRNPLIKLAKDQYASYEFYKKVKETMASETIHAIHCHDLNTLDTGKRLAEHFQSKLIYDSHELFNEMTGRNAVDRRFGYALEAKLMSQVDRFITVNPYLIDKFSKRYGKLPPSIYLQNIPLLGLEQERKNAHYFHHLYGIPTDKIILLYQGGFSKNRGIELCVKAMNHLPDQYHLVLLGDGDIKKALTQLVEVEMLTSRVHFHPKVPPSEILSLTKEADIGLVMYENVSENNYYSTPNKIFEYMLMGLPVVSSNHPGKSYLLEEYDFGIAVDENEQAIVKGIETIQQRRNYYVQKCDEASKVLNWPNESKKLIHLYNELFS
ncbi:glycosyltransferase [Guptibacillus hwajinpoensis]|uniref:glycosyltransferase n=1 Tax=Guptibacillus hwajinpoensis TaxID=208199 RepID=UPI001CFD3AA5|nr:glycosyltransferase [Pseudalkalibacillus hwajinpoensis]